MKILIPALLSLIVAVSSATSFADDFQDGSIQLDTDSGFSRSSTIKIDGRAATLIASGMYFALQNGAKNIVKSDNLIVGANFACREMPVNSSHFFCGAKFNKNSEGELLPLDPASFGN